MRAVAACAAGARQRIAAATLAALVLASCSVTPGDQIALSSPSFAPPPGPSGVAADELSGAAPAEASGTPAAGTEIQAAAGQAGAPDPADPELPAETAFLPAPSPAPAPGPAPATGPEPAVAASAEASDPRDADAATEIAAAAVAPPPAAPPAKRGLFGGFFDNSAFPAQQDEDFRGPRRAAKRPAPGQAPAPASPQPAQATVEVALAAPAPVPVPAPAGPAAAPPPAAAPQPAVFIENGPGPAAPPPPQKKGFLAGLFSSGPSDEPAARPVVERPQKPAPILTLASTGATAGRSAGERMDTLPGVRQSALFEITRKSGLDEDDDIDLHEDEGPVRVASAAGLARLAPNGLLRQTEHVDVGCLKPSLVRMLKTVERHYGKPMVVTSGYRSPSHNRRARGARNSLHMYCAAADVQVPGVSKWELASFVRTMAGRGGVGTYCHTESVHIDIGPERDWNWRCRRRKA